MSQALSYPRHLDKTLDFVDDRSLVARILEIYLFKGSHNNQLPPNISQVIIPGLESLLFRSGFPRPEHVANLPNLGIEEVITLNSLVGPPSQNLVALEKALSSYGIKHHLVKCKSTEITVPKIEEIIQLMIANLRGKLVHCLYGADRTGVAVACLRAFMGEKDYQKILKEMRNHLHVILPKYQYFHTEILPHFMNS